MSHYAHLRVDQWLRVVIMCYDQPLRLHCPSGSQLIRKQCLDKSEHFYIQLSLYLTAAVQNDKSSYSTG